MLDLWPTVRQDWAETSCCDQFTRLFSFIVILLVIEYMQLSIKFIYLASLMIGLTGSYVSTSMVCFSYIADLYTEQRQKTVRLGKH